MQYIRNPREYNAESMIRSYDLAHKPNILRKKIMYLIKLNAMTE